MDARCGDNTKTLNSKKKMEKLQEKSIRIVKFLPNNAPVLKVFKTYFL